MMGAIGAPRGWFQVGWSDEIEPGGILSRHAFGGERLLWRARSGALAAVNPHCPHLGAHLGVGGTIVGDCLVCPMHGWEWDADGTNVAIAG